MRKSHCITNFTTCIFRGTTSPLQFVQTPRPRIGVQLHQRLLCESIGIHGILCCRSAQQLHRNLEGQYLFTKQNIIMSSMRHDCWGKSLFTVLTLIHELIHLPNSAIHVSNHAFTHSTSLCIISPFCTDLNSIKLSRNVANFSSQLGQV